MTPTVQMPCSHGDCDICVAKSSRVCSPWSDQRTWPVRRDALVRRPAHARQRSAACASCSSRRCIPAPTTRTWACSSAQMELALRERGHEIDLAVLDRRGGGKRPLPRAARRRVPASAAARRRLRALPRPAGLIAARVEAPLVVTAHGRDVRNVGAIRGVARAHAPRRRRARRPSSRLGLPAPRARDEAARARAGRRRSSTRASTSSASATDADTVTGRPGLPLRRQRSPSARTSSGSPTRSPGSARGASPSSATARCAPQLEGRDRVRVVGRVPHDEVPRLLAARRRRLPAEPDRAARPVAARGDGVRRAPSSRRGSAARPSSCRPTPASSSTRSTSTRSRGRSASAAALPRPNDGRARRSRRARRQASGGADRGDSRASRRDRRA